VIFDGTSNEKLRTVNLPFMAGKPPSVEGLDMKSDFTGGILNVGDGLTVTKTALDRGMVATRVSFSTPMATGSN